MQVNLLYTSAESRGQVYAPTVNWLLLIAVIVLVLGFGSSSALAAAFGLAVTAAMVRNSETPMSFFKLPVNRVVELGSQVEI